MVWGERESEEDLLRTEGGGPWSNYRTWKKSIFSKKIKKSPVLILPHSLQAFSMGGFFFFLLMHLKNKTHLSLFFPSVKNFNGNNTLLFLPLHSIPLTDEAQLYILPPTDRHPAWFQASSSDDAAAAGSCAGTPFHTSQSGSWRNSLELPAASKDTPLSLP